MKITGLKHILSSKIHEKNNYANHLCSLTIEPLFCVDTFTKILKSSNTVLDPVMFLNHVFTLVQTC